MIYSPRKFRGLGVMCVEWEVFLQHFSIAKRLSTVPDQLLHHVYDSTADIDECKLVLQVDGETVRQLRTKLRESAFDSWASMGFSAEGMKHYKTVPRANNFVSDKNTLSCSEWTGAIKLSCNYANLNGVPQNDRLASNPHCRRCRRNETQPIHETPKHVLGACSFNDERRNDRHHRVKRSILKLLREKGYHCVEEAQCVDDKGSNRFIDILAFDPKENKAYLIDPTVRFETNDDVETEVQRDKSKTYVPCIPDLEQKYSQFGKRDFEVIGLWFGARGSLSRQVVDFFERFKLDKEKLYEIAERVLIDSIKMIHHHIYD